MFEELALALEFYFAKSGSFTVTFGGVKKNVVVSDVGSYDGSGTLVPNEPGGPAGSLGVMSFAQAFEFGFAAYEAIKSGQVEQFDVRVGNSALQVTVSNA